jgi:hypothetical protein
MTTVLLVPGAASLGNTATVEAALGGSQAMLTQLGDSSLANLVPVPYKDYDSFNGYIDAANQIIAKLKLIPAGERVVVKGHSYGAVGITQLLRTPAAIPIDPSLITFVCIANSIRLNNGYCTMQGLYGPGGGPVSTKYRVYDVAREFDRWADYPNNMWSPNYWQAVGNVLAGDQTSGSGAVNGVPNNIHNSYQNVSLTDPAAARVNIGNVTFSLHKTDPMPSPSNLSRAQIENAYNRIVSIGSAW